MTRGYWSHKCTDPLTRFMAKVKKTESCWLWQGLLNHAGYGRFGFQYKTVAAHRWIYEQLIGSIPEGYEVHHICCQQNCVNPDHLEVVSGRTNTLRSNNPAGINARKTHCLKGHKLNEKRRCPICQRENVRRWTERHHEELLERRRELSKRPEAREKARLYQNKRHAKNREAYNASAREYYWKRKAAM